MNLKLLVMLPALLLVNFSATQPDAFGFARPRIVVPDSIGCSAAPVIEAGAICVHTFDGSNAGDLTGIEFLNSIDSSPTKAAGVVYSVEDDAARTLAIKTLCRAYGANCEFGTPTPSPTP